MDCLPPARSGITSARAARADQRRAPEAALTETPDTTGAAGARSLVGDGARIRAYRQFWPYYLRQHARPATRALHFAGTGVALVFLGLFVATRDWRFPIAAIVSGYGLAWIGHFGPERNRPAAFRYPLWSLFSDFRMFFSWLSGRLPDQLARAGVAGAPRERG